MNRSDSTKRAVCNGYIGRIEEVVNLALQDHSRTSAIRIDLRFPDINTDHPSYFVNSDTSAITRFIRSLEAQLKADLARKSARQQRVLKNTLRYCWVREYGPKSQKPHYHVLLFLNKDIYAFLGDYKAGEGNLASKIQRAWCSALGIDVDWFSSLVQFHNPAVYYLDVNSCEFQNNLRRFLLDAEYLAKEYSKVISPRARSFGCSSR